MSAVKEKSAIQQHVEHIKAQLECRDNKWIEEYKDEGNDHEPTAWDYLESVLDIQYVVNSNEEYLGARALVAFGGPNIWINTLMGTVEGYWWDESHITHFDDELGVNEVLEELWGCR